MKGGETNTIQTGFRPGKNTIDTRILKKGDDCICRRAMLCMLAMALEAALAGMNAF